MFKTLTDTKIIVEPGKAANHFGETHYHLLNRHSRNQIAKVDQLMSKSTDVCHIKLKSAAIIEFVPAKDTICIVLKPIQATGIGPFVCAKDCGKDNLIGISAVNHTAPLWTADLSGTEFYCLSVKRSLLAKHAYDIVDTSVLESMQFLTLDDERSQLLKDKLAQLLAETNSTQVLDIRLTHLMLSICEVANHTAETNRQSAAETLWQCLRDTPADEISVSMLREHGGLTENQFNHLVKRLTGLSARQFVANYRLNCIRQALLERSQTFTECVVAYDYQSPDQLYRAYRRLFNDEPPLNFA
ncbi:MAG: AraC-like DNA-binding protein [Candidatus Azotimanducaceae bacterium]|jgi:AraC-like DNA-binding protein